MTICLVSQEYPVETDFGGISTYNYYLSNGLIKYGADVYVVCRSYIRNSFKIVDKIIIIRIYENDEILYRKKVAEAIKNIHETTKIDVIESPEWQADLFEYYKMYKDTLKIPVVIKLHTPYFVWKKYNKSNTTLYSDQIELWEKHIICNANGVISCSDSLKNIVANEYKIPASQILTLPNMIDINEEGEHFKYTRIKDSIFYIGSLEERKGVLVLAAVFKKIKSIIPSASIYFVGRDTTRNCKNVSTKDYIKCILDGVQDVNFVEHVDNSEVSEYMKQSNVMVFPSLYENFPYVVLEAMKYGCAIVGSSNGGMQEMINDNINGMLYTPPSEKSLEEKILKILGNDEFADTVRVNALVKVKDFSMENIIPKQISYYNELI